MRLPKPIERALCLLLTASISSLSACSSTRVKEHEDYENKPSIKIRAFYKNKEDKKYYVAGLRCQLIRKDGDQSKEIGFITTIAEGPVFFKELQPGLYKVVIRLGDERTSEEVEVKANQRLTVRVDVDAIEKGPFVKTSGEVAKGAAYIAVGAGALILLVSIKILIAAAEDDDDDDRCNCPNVHSVNCRYYRR